MNREPAGRKPVHGKHCGTRGDRSHPMIHTFTAAEQRCIPPPGVRSGVPRGGERPAVGRFARDGYRLLSRAPASSNCQVRQKIVLTRVSRGTWSRRPSACSPRQPTLRQVYGDTHTLPDFMLEHFFTGWRGIDPAIENIRGILGGETGGPVAARYHWRLEHHAPRRQEAPAGQDGTPSPRDSISTRSGRDGRSLRQGQRSDARPLCRLAVFS